MKVIFLAALLLVLGTVFCNYSCIVPKAGRSYGESTECVALVKYACNAPRTTQWKRGMKVRGNAVPANTAIATFADGVHYKGHGAIYLGQNNNGIQVLDQWNGHAASQRTIRWNGNGLSNNGDSFYVVE